MKISIINTAYYPNIIGGTEISVQILAENLAKSNEVSVICVGEKDCYELLNDVHVYRIGSLFKSRAERIFKELYNKKLLGKVKQILEKIKPDIVHTNNIYPFSPIVWKIARLNGIPVVHTIRDYYLLGSSIAIKNAYFRHFSKYVTSVTAASSYTLEEHVKKGYFKKAWTKVVIPNAIKFDFDRFKRIREKRECNYSKSIRFGFVGRLEVEKGILILLDVFNQMQNSELKIFGKGPLESVVSNYAQRNSNIHFMGFCDQESLMRFLEDVDVLIVPTLSTFQEPFGRVVLDAYVNCIPVIASTVGGLKNIVINGKTGALFEADNCTALLKAMALMQERNEIKKYYSQIEQVVKKYTIDNQIRTFNRLYLDLIKG